MAAGESSERRVDALVASGEQAPGWLPSALARVTEEVAQLEREEQLRISRQKPGGDAAGEAAAQRAQKMRDENAQERTKAEKTLFDLSKAFELFVALGLKGKAADVRGSGKFYPGWLGRMAEISLADDALDIHKGIDFVARFPTGAGELTFGIDATYSSKKLDSKFGKIRDMIERGEASALTEAESGPSTLRLVLGVSREPMMEAVREWSKDGTRVEAYDEANVALGTCLREQVIGQLTAFEAYARTCGQTALAERYKGALDTISNWVAPKAKVNPLKSDPVHLEILKWARSLNQH